MVFNRIFSISRKIHRKFNESFKDTGLGSGQVFILLSVIENPGINQDCLCRILDLDKSTVTKGMKTLHNDKYIIRVRDKKDKRNWILFPSKKGERIYNDLNNRVKEFEKKIIREISEIDINLFHEVLKKIEENALL